MAFWWVNHKQTRDHEVRGGYQWSPMRNADGVRNQSYENMRLARPGDIVFSYAHGRIGAIGRVTEAATACPKPDEFGDVGGYWSNEGWMVEVDFRPAPRPLQPGQPIDLIGPLLPTRYSPKRVIMPDGACRITGVTDARALVASHIKPWREADNAARLNGNNGVLLSPHVDALFDEELLSFEDDGQMLVHPSLSPDVLYRWSIDPAQRVEPFRGEQRPFLARHRELFAQKTR